ncbi:MAG: pyruvate kinase [Coriobacteriia bacterium]
MRRTRIVATIGPACESPEMLDRLLAAGMDVARLNASHAGPGELDARLLAVREAEERAGRPVAVMLDLGGPKVRVGDVGEGTVLVAGTRFDLVAGECPGSATQACVTYADLASDLTAGDRVLIDDGRIALVVESTAPGRVSTRVETGGPLSSRKGVNVPGVTLAVDAITAKDAADLAWGLAAGVDLVAMSFVREPGDLDRLRALMGERRLPIVAKIEKHEAVERLGSIVEVADAIMVARGDLGVETSPERVPLVQRRIITACRDRGVPVIVATQMLESMVSAPRPTRAEASDVANAIFERVDAVMLSGETAVGAHPVEAVETMARIAAAAEEEFTPAGPLPSRGGSVTEAVSAAACELAADLRLAAIVTATESGATSRAVARHRPSTPVLALTPDPRVARALMLVWGVTPRVVAPSDSVEHMAALAAKAAAEYGLARSGDLIALTAGVTVNRPGTTNLVEVIPVP